MSIKAKLADAAQACRDALAREDRAGVIQSLPGAPQDAEGWFGLLSGYPENSGSVEAIRGMKAALSSSGQEDDGSVERYALLQALTVGAKGIETRPIADSVKHCFAATCVEIAGKQKHWDRFYDESSIHFMEVAKLAVLQRYPAGDLVFAIYNRLPFAWAFKIAPWQLPGYLRQIAAGFGGSGPLISPHINNGRVSQPMMLKSRSLRSLWRIAKTVELDPRIKGLYAVSWFLSAETGRHFPHIEWMRTMYTDEVAYAVDMEAAPSDSGVLEGSEPRRKLYQEGKFNPRRSVILWPRQEFLAWAARHPELADPNDEPVKAPETGRWRGLIARGPAHTVQRGRHNSFLHLWDGLALLNRNPKAYILRVFFLPALIASAAAALFLGWSAAVPAFILTAFAAWIVQYYCFQ